MRPKSIVRQSIDSEIGDLQRIIEADQAILQHDKSEEKHHQLMSEINSAVKRITWLKIKRALFK